MVHTKWLLCYWRSSFLVWSCMRAMTGKLWPWNCLPLHNVLIQIHLWLLCMYSGCGINSQATPGLLSMCALQSAMLANKCVPRSLTIDFSASLLEDCLVQQRTFLCMSGSDYISKMGSIWKSAWKPPSTKKKTTVTRGKVSAKLHFKCRDGPANTIETRQGLKHARRPPYYGTVAEKIMQRSHPSSAVYVG